MLVLDPGPSSLHWPHRRSLTCASGLTNDKVHRLPMLERVQRESGHRVGTVNRVLGEGSHTTESGLSIAESCSPIVESHSSITGTGPFAAESGQLFIESGISRLTLKCRSPMADSGEVRRMRIIESGGSPSLKMTESAFTDDVNRDDVIPHRRVIILVRAPCVISSGLLTSSWPRSDLLSSIESLGQFS